MAQLNDISDKLDIADIRPGSIHAETGEETTISLRSRDEMAEIHSGEAGYIKWAIETPFVAVKSVERDEAGYISGILAEFPQQALRMGPFPGQSGQSAPENGRKTLQDCRI